MFGLHRFLSHVHPSSGSVIGAAIVRRKIQPPPSHTIKRIIFGNELRMYDNNYDPGLSITVNSMGPVRIRHSAHDFGWQSTESSPVIDRTEPKKKIRFAKQKIRFDFFGSTPTRPGRNLTRTFSKTEPKFGLQNLPILWISLGGKPKWLLLKFGYHDVMRTSPISKISLQCHMFSILLMINAMLNVVLILSSIPHKSNFFRAPL